MFELHPAVQHMADKGYEGATIDEMAIVNTMRRSLQDSYNTFIQLKYWLQQENPHKLRGDALSKWATSIAEWVLPTQMRGYHGKEQNEQSREGNEGVQERITEIERRKEGHEPEAGSSDRTI